MNVTEGDRMEERAKLMSKDKIKANIFPHFASPKKRVTKFPFEDF